MVWCCFSKIKLDVSLKWWKIFISFILLVKGKLVYWWSHVCLLHFNLYSNVRFVFPWWWRWYQYYEAARQYWVTIRRHDSFTPMVYLVIMICARLRGYIMSIITRSIVILSSFFLCILHQPVRPFGLEVLCRRRWFEAPLGVCLDRY